MYEKITPDNVLMYAIRNYTNPHCEGEKEFEDDLKRFKYIKRLLRKYYDTGVLKERLLLNHLIVIFNSFGIEAGLNILELKLDKRHWPVIKPFLVYLRYIKDNQYTGISMDKNVVGLLRKI